MKKYILYARVGSTRQTRKSATIDYQLQRLRDYAQQNGLQIGETVKDIGAGSNDNRAGIKNLIKKLSDGLYQGVLCTDFSKLSRSVVLSAKLWQLICEKGIEIITPYKTYKNDTQSKIAIEIQMTLAETYRKNHSESIKRGLQNKKLRTESRKKK